MKYFEKIELDTWDTVRDGLIHLKDEMTKYETRPVDATTKAWLTEQLASAMAGITGKQHTVSSALIFALPAGQSGTLHVDGNDPLRKDHPNSALNIPLYNCDHNQMSWYSGSYELLAKVGDTGIKYLDMLWLDEPVEVCTTVIDTPTLVRVNVPHNVRNNSDDLRLVISVRFNPDIIEDWT
jgi:hypothetical protein